MNNSRSIPDKIDTSIDINHFSQQAELHLTEVIRNAIEDGKTVCHAAAKLNHKSNAGSWAVILRKGNLELEYTGATSSTNIQRVTSLLFLKCFELAEDKNNLLIITDSSYHQFLIEKGGLAKWRRYGWKGFGGTELKDADLWKKLLADIEVFKPKVLYVPPWFIIPQIVRIKQMAVDFWSGVTDMQDIPSDELEAPKNIVNQEGTKSTGASNSGRKKPSSNKTRKKRTFKKAKSKKAVMKKHGSSKKSPYTSKPRVSRTNS